MAQSKISVTVSIGENKVTLEGPEDFVRQEVQRLTNSVASGPVGAPRNSASGAEGIRNETAPSSERELIAAKQPKGHPEIVAVLGYFLSQGGHTEFTGDDIRRAYIRAAQRPPKVIEQALRDAKNVKDFVERGAKKGTYRLTPHGERTVVFDLPRSKSNS